MSWNRRTCGMSTASSLIDNSGTSCNFSPQSQIRDYEAPAGSVTVPLPAQTLPSSSSSSSSSSFSFHSSSDYIANQSTREREDECSSLPPLGFHNYQLHSYSHIYSPMYSTRVHMPESCSCQNTIDGTTYELSSSLQSPCLYEQYLTSFRNEQSEHLPYLFDNVVYPQPCSPPSPTNDSITYYQLDHAHTNTIINRLPLRSHLTTIQPIIYQQLSLVEPPSSNSQQRLPTVKRFYCDSTMATTTNIETIDHIHVPYARLDSSAFGTYEIWQERTVVGRKTSRRDVDVNLGKSTTCSKSNTNIVCSIKISESTLQVSRVHFELILINSTEFHLKCLSKNGIFINNNYTKLLATTIVPKQYATGIN
jgi:hypothetical protein